MLRLRRYRVFVAFAVFALVVLYYFGSARSSWRDANTETRPLEKANNPGKPLAWKPRPQVAHETKRLSLAIAAAQTPLSLQRPPAITPIHRPIDKAPTSPNPTGTASLTSIAKVEPPHWTKQKERFPLPSSEIIPIPTGKPKPIPKIQHIFKRETPEEKADREEKLGIIKGVFEKSWNGYREYAWMQDELSPASGKFRNPFAGWGATLVDSLDTLWIMGLKEDFEEAVEAVGKIDFTTTHKNDIPVFETTIRYLGGFLAAYDLSDGKYDILLKKAVELGEVLMSVFDTRNRMPITYYRWHLREDLQPLRASPSIVLAEIGSLTMEFTRLAQLTGISKYYDAVARITNNLEEFQNRTRLPGMWPTQFDASGCKVIDYSEEDQAALEVENQAILEAANTEPLPVLDESPIATTDEPLSPNGKKYIPLDLPSPIALKAVPTPAAESPEAIVKNLPVPAETPAPAMGEALSSDGKKYKPLDLPEPVVFKAQAEGAAEPSPTLAPEAHNLKRRQLVDMEGLDVDPTPAQTETSSTAPASPTPTRPECEEQGFESTSAGSEEYTLGGMSDSTYEYLPKEYLLLGGQIDKYRTMYEASIDVVKQSLLFRPMLPNNTDILFSGKLHVPYVPPGSKTPANAKKGELEAENAHLTCFAGGMFGMGAKIFDRPEDLEIAKKLTEGCIWSYDMMPTGIMPESFLAVPCESMEHCEWNETKYLEILDPGAEQRVRFYEQSIERYKEDIASASSWYEAALVAMTAAPVPSSSSTEVEATATAEATESAASSAKAKSTPVTRVEAELESGFEKRQLHDDTEDAPVPAAAPTPKEAVSTPKAPVPVPVNAPVKAPVKPPANSIPGWKAPDRNPKMRGGASAPESNMVLIGGHSKKPDLTKEQNEEPGAPELPPTPVQPEQSAEPSPTLPEFPNVYSPMPPVSHDEYAQNIIKNQHLPKGIASIPRRSYILRPEAIESVWYMYRITGDPYYRSAGWRMFQAINKATSTTYGNSAIDDVTTSTRILKNDEMESFWLAETLKYFYLLFAEEGVVSLDDWVLNTEAHPFRRPS